MRTEDQRRAGVRTLGRQARDDDHDADAEVRPPSSPVCWSYTVQGELMIMLSGDCDLDHDERVILPEPAFAVSATSAQCTRNGSACAIHGRASTHDSSGAGVLGCPRLLCATQEAQRESQRGTRAAVA